MGRAVPNDGRSVGAVSSMRHMSPCRYSISTSFDPGPDDEYQKMTYQQSQVLAQSPPLLQMLPPLGQISTHPSAVSVVFAVDTCLEWSVYVREVGLEMFTLQKNDSFVNLEPVMP